MGDDFTEKIKKKKTIVWDAIITAMKPEKKFWTAEIEIWPLVMSEGSQSQNKCRRVHYVVTFLRPYCWHHVVDDQVLRDFASRQTLNFRFLSSRNIFFINFIKNWTPNDFYAFCPGPKFLISFCNFLYFYNFAQNCFSQIFDGFCP